MSNYKIVCDADADRTAWLNARMGMITASDVPGLLGTVEWTSPLRIYLQKVGDAPEEAQADFLEWGREMEEPIRRWFERKTERVTYREQSLLQSVEYPWLGCTLDAWAKGDDGELLPLELKTTRFKGDDWEDGIPPHVRDQLLTQCLVVGAARGFACVSRLGAPPEWIDITVADHAERVDEILQRTKELWDRVEREDPPEPTGSMADHAAAKHVAGEEVPGKTITLGHDIADLTERYGKVSLLLRDAEKEKRLLQQRLILALGDAEKGVLPDGATAWTYKTQQRREYTVEAQSIRVLRKGKA